MPSGPAGGHFAQKFLEGVWGDLLFKKVPPHSIQNMNVNIWDRWSVHRSAPVRGYCEKHARRIRVERLPSYAPELNPVEQGWSHTKCGELANFAPHDIGHLDDAVRRSIRSKRGNQVLLLSFVRQTGLRA